MRESSGRSPFSALTWLICIIAGVFVLENIVVQWIGGAVATGFFEYLTLSPEAITRGFVWTLATHGLIHHPHNLLHLGLTLLSLYVFGRAVVPEIGSRRLLTVFTAAVIAGGLAWLAVNWSHGGSLFGASAGVSALIVLFACLMPHQPIAPFMIDIGLRAKHLAIGLLIIDVLGLILLEIPGRTSWFAMSHSAHLGGMLAAWLYHRFVYERDWRPFAAKPAIELPRWFRKKKSGVTESPAYKVNLGAGNDLRAEIDRILDKINSEGFQSLTAEEKKRLDHARDHLSRR